MVIYGNVPWDIKNKFGHSIALRIKQVNRFMATRKVEPPTRYVQRARSEKRQLGLTASSN
jgi:hypothetical protein